jgi:hypothetical protein
MNSVASSPPVEQFVRGDELCGEGFFILLELRVGFRSECDILACIEFGGTKLFEWNRDYAMKAMGFVLLLAGWLLVLGAIVLFPAAGLRAAFVLAGVAVEALGLVLAFRSHLIAREDKA